MAYLVLDTGLYPETPSLFSFNPPPLITNILLSFLFVYKFNCLDFTYMWYNTILVFL